MSGKLAIAASTLTRRFGNITAVDAVDLSVMGGELFSLLGPNGAGKTTMIRMLCCLLKPTGGRATVAGYDIMREPDAVKQHTNVSPQETAVAAHLTARENLILMGRVYGMGSAEARARAKELLDLLGLSGTTKQQARHLSGGMQRRLSIAMALISDPDVLFLDEPTVGLDPQARRGLWDQIRTLKGKTTILLTTHYLEEADALADRIGVIKGGKIVALGTPAELKRGLIGMQTMLVRGSNFSEEALRALQNRYATVERSGGDVEVQAPELDFHHIVDTLRSGGGRIAWLTMKEPTLDDVFLSLTEEETQE